MSGLGDTFEGKRTVQEFEVGVGDWVGDKEAYPPQPLFVDICQLQKVVCSNKVRVVFLLGPCKKMFRFAINQRKYTY